MIVDPSTRGAFFSIAGTLKTKNDIVVKSSRRIEKRENLGTRVKNTQKTLTSHRYRYRKN